MKVELSNDTGRSCHNDHGPLYCVERMWVAAEATNELPHTSPISVHHAQPAGPAGSVIGSLREAVRTRVFAARRSSLRG